MLKKFLHILLKTLAVVAVFIATLFVFFIFNKETVFDDGPFQGKMIEKSPIVKPSQNFKLWNDKTLKVYNRQQDKKPPIVCLSSNEELKWCIEATAYEETQVLSLEFIEYKTFPYITPKAYALVDWTYGKEIATFHITYDGELKKYYYSW